MTTDPQPVQYDSEREAIDSILANLDDVQAEDAPWRHLVAALPDAERRGASAAIVIFSAQIADHIKDRLARVRAAPAPPATPNLEWITAISAERERQDSKWGGPEHDDHHSAEDWERFIMRRIPLASRLDKPFRKRMVEIGALAVAAIQSYDREHGGLKSATAPSPADGAAKILADLIHFKDKGDQSVGFAASQKSWADARAFLAARTEGGK